MARERPQILGAPPEEPVGRRGLPLAAAVAAVALGLGIIAWFPPPAGPAGGPPLAVNQSPVPPDLQRWGAMYEELSRLPLALEAPTLLDDGSRMTAISVWRPGWYATGSVWHWLLADPAGRWALVVVDPTVRHKVSSDEALALGTLETVRLVEGGGGFVTMEWDRPGYAMTIHAAGIPEDELLALAAGIVPPGEPSLVATEPPALTSIPEGMELVVRTGGEASTAGPGKSGWRAGYVIVGGRRGTVTVTAAEGRALPFTQTFRAAPGLHSEIRDAPALAFDYPGASPISLTTTRSRLVWVEDGVMIEAVSNRLPLAELSALVEDLDLNGDAGD